jgi:hypothetical protein
MRKEDLEILSKPYDQDESNEKGRFNSALGADVESLSNLLDELVDDLAPQYGVAWWTSLPTHQRVAIGDYLYQCVFAIETNLAEARLHYLEVLGTRRDQDRRIASAVQLQNGEPIVKLRPPTSPLDELPDRLEMMHVGGFFRALGSALDCIGAAIIIVLGLDTQLRRAGFKTALKILDELDKKGVPTPIQLDFKQFIEAAIESLGPTDWLNWMSEHRNLLIHRGRLIIQKEIVPAGVMLYDHRGVPIVRSKQISHLPRFPDKSDIEAWATTKYTILSEDADTTMQGLFHSTRNLILEVGDHLTSAWQRRRSNPVEILQPATQWGPKSSSSAFVGYSGAAPIAMDTITMSPATSKRFRAAGLYDLPHFWADCDFL